VAGPVGASELDGGVIGVEDGGARSTEREGIVRGDGEGGGEERQERDEGEQKERHGRWMEERQELQLSFELSVSMVR